MVTKVNISKRRGKGIIVNNCCTYESLIFIVLAVNFGILVFFLKFIFVMNSLKIEEIMNKYDFSIISFLKRNLISMLYYVYLERDLNLNIITFY